MKVLVCVLAVVLACQAISDDEVIRQWKEFQVNFKKTYKSSRESQNRLNIFKENLEIIEAHNARYENGLETYDMGVNQFADWTSEEFLQYVNKFQMQSFPQGNLVSTANFTLELPASVDWRQQNAVREVKDQGQCGSCWSFSTVAAVEGQLALKKNIYVSLSEQNLIDCAGQSYGCDGCKGGTIPGSFMYIAQNGITTEANYPYKSSKGSCRSLTPKYKINYYANVVSNEASLKSAVANMGPVSVAIEATSNLQRYRSGVIYDKSCTHKLNHAVLAIGYGEENGNEYWLVKNSWGASWGEQGYFKLARNRGNNCGIADIAAFPQI